MTKLIKSLVLMAIFSAAGAQANTQTTWANDKIAQNESSEIQSSTLKSYNPDFLEATEDDTYISDYIIVELKSGDIPSTKQQAIAESINGVVIGSYEKFNWVQIQISEPSLENLAKQGHKLLKNPDVKSISFDYILQQ